MAKRHKPLARRTADRSSNCMAGSSVVTASRADEMAAFEKLPKRIRQYLISNDYKFSAIQTLRAYRQIRSIEAVIEHLARVTAKKASAYQQGLERGFR